MNPALNPEPGDISRQRAGAQVAFHPGKYLRNVVGVQIAVSASRRSRLADLFSLLGFAAEDRRASTVWRGADFEVEIKVVPDSHDCAPRKGPA